MDAPGLGAGESIREGGERVAAVEIEAGFEGVHGKGVRQAHSAAGGEAGRGGAGAH